MKYFTVGPTQTHPWFEEHLQKALENDIPNISHRSPQFVELFNELRDNVKKLLHAPNDYEVVFLGSATEFMDRIVQNLSSKETLHVIQGSFAERAHTFAEGAGRTTHRVEQEDDSSVSVKSLPTNVSPETVFLTYSETSTGARLPREFIDTVCETYPEALIAIDVVSAAPVCDIPIEKMDCTYFSVQKGFGLPAGIGVGLLSPRALKKAEEIFPEERHLKVFRSFPALVELGAKGKTLETPNVLLMYLLNEYLKILIDTGTKTLQEQTEEKAQLLYDAIGQSDELEPSIENEQWRSKTVVVAKTKNESKELIEKTKAAGYLIAGGYGKKKSENIRIANFPQHQINDTRQIAELLFS